MNKEKSASRRFLTVLVIILCAAVVACPVIGKKASGTDGTNPITNAVVQSTLAAGQSSYNTDTKGLSAYGLSDYSGIRGVWINYLEFGEMIKGKSLEQYRDNVEKCLDNIEDLNLNTVILHIRSHCDAFYNSDIFPYSYQLSGKQGDGCGFDPLSEFITLAHDRNIRVEGWINPYRAASGKSGLSGIAQNSPIWDFSFEKGEIVTLDTGTYLNPSSEKSTELIVKGVKEVIDRYTVDGIQFDDYFYPAADQSFDSALYEQYSASTESPLSLEDFRRESVNKMLKAVYNEVKQKQSMTFSVSPAADISKDTDVLFADVKKWCKGGYCDYICPQIYFGYEYPKDGFDFSSLLWAWQSLCNDSGRNIGLTIGLAPYKIGKTDGGSDEWKQSTDILKRQAEQAKTVGAGICFYNYSSLFADSELAAAQRENLKGAIN